MGWITECTRVLECTTERVLESHRTLVLKESASERYDLSESRRLWETYMYRMDTKNDTQIAPLGKA